MSSRRKRGTLSLKGQRRLHGTVRWGSIFLIFLPVFLSIAYVHRFGVSVVFWDQWEMVALFRKLDVGTLSFWDLWALHNEHRFFFPRIAMLAIGVVTGWNNVYEMYLIQGCLLLTLACLWFAFDIGKNHKLLFFVPIAFMVFTLRQSENMLWGYQITFAFAQTFSVLALLLLRASTLGKRKAPILLAAIASATFASFSAAQALFVWPAGLVQLLLSPLERGARRVLIAVWCSIGLLVWVVYFLGYDSDAAASPMGSPTLVARHFVTLLGNSLFLGNILFSQSAFAFANGLLLLGLALATVFLAVRHGDLGRYSFWFSLTVFSLLVIASIAAGRSGLGEENAMAPRYTTFTILATIGLYAGLVQLSLENKIRFAAALLGILLMVVVVNIPLSYRSGINKGFRNEAARMEAAQVLHTYESQPNERLKTLHNNPENVRRRAPILEELGYNVFSKP